MKNKIPIYGPKTKDNGYPNAQVSVERDPEAKPIRSNLAVFADTFFPSDQYDVTGGGLIDPSVQDQITMGPRNATEEQDDPEHALKDYHSQLADLTIPYDEEYGFAGLARQEIPGNDGTPDSVKQQHALQEFKASSYQGAMLVRSVGTVATYNTFNIAVGADPLPILGEDWSRRSAIVRALAANTGNVLVGNSNSLVAQQGAGTGAFVLEPGKDLIINNTDSLVAILPAGGNAAQIITVINESYER